MPAIGIGGGLLLAAIITSMLLAAGRAGRWAVPLESSAPTPPSIAQGHTSTGQPEPPPERREPTFAEAAEFAVSYQPPAATAKRMVAANVNADGRREIVFVSIAGGISRVDIAAWDGAAYQIVAMVQGGPATEIVDLQIRDATRDRVPEVIVTQRADQATSVSIWGWDGATYAPQVARGGCANGQNTFGVDGAQVGVGTIIATCAASQRSKDVYTWSQRAKAWIFKKA